MKNQERLLVTIGDPAGCGPQVTVDALLNLPEKDNIYLVGDIPILRKISGFNILEPHIALIDTKSKDINKIKPGQPTRASGAAALNYLDVATAFMKNFNIKRLVTAPVSKEAIQLVNKTFIGHTEYLAQKFNTPHVEMMMVSPGFNVVLFTRHIPLNEISKHFNVTDYTATIKLVYDTMRKSFNIDRPRIGITAVNPHAGVNTFLGKEEKVMVAAIKKSGKKVIGPLPADTIFAPQNLRNYDCIICAYHDQGMIPFKLLSFRSGVNFTAGLPIIRTSPAHGTAFDLVKAKKPADSSSMLEAIKLAIKLEI
jgi:4-hydroxythreonine-4-phosphate dehydrogenase